MVNNWHLQDILARYIYFRFNIFFNYLLINCLFYLNLFILSWIDMSNFNYEKWQEIKEIALRLQAIVSLLRMLNDQISPKNELIRLKQQLQIDFEQSLNRLINILEDDQDDLEDD